jgi:hypothetical protein
MLVKHGRLDLTYLLTCPKIWARSRVPHRGSSPRVGIFCK